MSDNLLLTPIKVGPLTLPNRVFMAPLTRLRSIEPGDIPTELMAEYYQQRASAGLIITEATQVSYQSKGYAGAPGLHTAEQIAAWQKITHSVHQANGHIAVQLWHTGRIGHSSLQPDGGAPVTATAGPAEIRTSLKDKEGKVYRADVTPARELTTEETRQVVDDFIQAAANAKQAGFDLLEIHGAHGYLIHQFLSPESNKRQDIYGGSRENRARFLFEIIEGMAKVWDISRIGLRLSPIGDFQGTANGDNEEEDAVWLLQQLNQYKLAYVHLSEPDWMGGAAYSMTLRQRLRAAFEGVLIGAGAYDKKKAQTMLEQGVIDAVAFGRDFIANPDLVARLASDAALNPQRPELFYGGGAEGYTDYPLLDSH